MSDKTTYRTPGLGHCPPAAPGSRQRPCLRHPVGIIGRALRSAATVAFAVLCTAVPSGCTKELGETSASRRPLVVYMALDNDLRGEFSSRLAALRAGWRPGMELWVYTDTPEGASLGRMDSTPEGATLRTVERYGAENSASGATLERVLRTVWRLCPSDGYGLLFFSHATGWLPAGTLGHPSGSRSVGSDHGSEIELESFAAALPEGMPLDYVVFECCLMAGAEVMLELQGRTPWVLASSAEVVAPGFRPLYERGLEVLAERTRPVPELLAAFGQSYMSHVEGLSGEYRSATLSVVHTEALPRLAGEVRRWGRAARTVTRPRHRFPTAFSTSTARGCTATVLPPLGSSTWRSGWRRSRARARRCRPSVRRSRTPWCGAPPRSGFWAARAAPTGVSTSAATRALRSTFRAGSFRN